MGHETPPALALTLRRAGPAVFSGALGTVFGCKFSHTISFGPDGSARFRAGPGRFLHASGHRTEMYKHSCEGGPAARGQASRPGPAAGFPAFYNGACVT